VQANVKVEGDPAKNHQKSSIYLQNSMEIDDF
jgi:hypothetical protein